MDIFEKANSKFSKWYERLFGQVDSISPKDILRLIIQSMEEKRVEDVDNKIYVPNSYVLKVAIADQEQKEQLLSFFNPSTYEKRLREYCNQQKFTIRGYLQILIEETPLEEASEKQRNRIRIECRYDPKIAPPAPLPNPAPVLPAAPDDDRTVSSPVMDDEGGTVPAVVSAILQISPAGKPMFEYRIAKQLITIGRSQRAANDIVIDTDAQMSRQHIKIELNSEGKFTLTDQNTTNGTIVNGTRVQKQELKNGDQIRIGTTNLLLLMEDNAPVDVFAPPHQGIGFPVQDAHIKNKPVSIDIPHRPLQVRTSRLVLVEDDKDTCDFLLGSETIIGRSQICDVVLNDRSVSMRHAKVTLFSDGFYFEVTRSDAEPVLINGNKLQLGHKHLLADGDRIQIGFILLRFVAGN